MIRQPIQSNTDDKQNEGSASWRTQIQPPPLPPATSPWAAYRDAAALKRLLLARVLTLQQKEDRLLRPLRQNLAAPNAAPAPSASQVDEREHGLRQENEAVQQQVVNHNRHLDRTQTPQDHHAFSSRFRAR